MSRLRDLMDAGEPAIGVQLRFGSPAISEMAGHAGFDWILLDAEHAPQTATGMQAQLQAIGCTPATPVVRLGRCADDLIRLYLDMGAMGIAVPFISTPEQAREGAEACRYPPRGTRGWGPHRAAAYGLDEQGYTGRIDDEVVFLPIIETAEAVECIGDLMAVEGVDGCIVGPVDLCYSLGIPFQFDHEDYLAAVDRVREGCERAGKPAGLPLIGSVSDRAAIRAQVEAGTRLLLVAGDEPLLGTALRQSVDDLAFLREGA